MIPLGVGVQDVLAESQGLAEHRDQHDEAHGEDQGTEGRTDHGVGHDSGDEGGQRLIADVGIHDDLHGQRRDQHQGSAEDVQKKDAGEVQPVRFLLPQYPAADAPAGLWRLAHHQSTSPIV